MKFLTGLFILLFATSVFGSDIVPVLYPYEVVKEVPARSDRDLISGKIWNRWTTRNFVVCSLSNSQARYLHDHLEGMKTKLFKRWGMYDINWGQHGIDHERKLLCVNDPYLFEKLFRSKHTKVEVRRDGNGDIKETVIFLLLNKRPEKALPEALTEMCIAEFEHKFETRFAWWVHRGMSMLNDSIEDVRKNLGHKDSKYAVSDLMTVTENDYKAMGDEQKVVFDRAAMRLCLLIKKEFGTVKFQQMMRDTATNKKPEKGIQKVLGFDGFGDFDKNYQRFTKDLTVDIRRGITPDFYLDVEPH